MTADEAWPERYGIEPVPNQARTTSPRSLFAICLAPGLGLVPIGVGTIAAAQFIGLGWWDGLLAIVLGNALAGVLVGLLAIRGSHAGVAQMASARATFGKSIVVPAAVTWATLISWAAVYTVFGAQAVVQLTDGAAPLWLGAVAHRRWSGAVGRSRLSGDSPLRAIRRGDPCGPLRDHHRCPIGQDRPWTR